MLFTILSATAKEVFTDIGFVIVALLALMLMIVIHEGGHYTAAKILKFRVDEFGIGMGPPLYKHTNRKTGEVFTIRPFPIGGFCAFHGEDEDKDDPTAFNNQKPWKRMIVLFAGAFMNFISAIFIISIYFAAYGQILPVVNHVPTSSINNTSMLQYGDIILRVDGKQVNLMDNTDFYKVTNKMGETATIKVLRNGDVLKLKVSKQYYQIFDEGDKIVEINGKKLENEIPYENLSEFVNSNSELKGSTSLNVVVKYVNEDGTGGQYPITVYKGNPLDPDSFYAWDYGIHGLRTQKLPFGLALGRSFGFSFFIVFKILASIGLLITGQIGLEGAGGTITIISTMAEVSSMGFGSFLYVVAIISANLAVMNLLPLPALDGSRMVFTLIEMIFRKPVPRKIEAVIHSVGLILLLLLAVFLDIFHLAHI